jgi:hypothetical protein
MAVYADFERQGDYLPNLVYSRIVERLASNSFQVSYEYKVFSSSPVFQNIHLYVVHPRHASATIDR